MDPMKRPSKRARMQQGPFSWLGPQIGSELVLTGDPPLSDSGLRNNPGTVGIHQLRNINVGYDSVWHVSTDSDDRTAIF